MRRIFSFTAWGVLLWWAISTVLLIVAYPLPFIAYALISLSDGFVAIALVLALAFLYNLLGD